METVNILLYLVVLIVFVDFNATKMSKLNSLAESS